MSSLIVNSNNAHSRVHHEGRTYFEDLDTAMRSYGVPVAAQRIVRETLGAIVYDELWVPASRCYIAVRRNGTAVAWVHKTKIGIPGRPKVELPGYAVRTRAAGSTKNGRHGEICRRHFLAMSMAGNCPDSPDCPGK